MRLTIIIVVATGIFSFANAQSDTLLKGFRTTYLSNKKKLSLGANVETIKDIVVKVSDKSYHLKKGSFSVADSIGIETDKDSKIIAVYFFYNYAPEFSNDTIYIHELRKYKKVIGSKGEECFSKKEDREIKVTAWKDKTFNFELIELIKGSQKKTYSVIFERAAYLNRENIKDKNLCSIELGRLFGS